MFFGFQYYFRYEFKVNILVHRHFSKDTQNNGLIVMIFYWCAFFLVLCCLTDDFTSGKRLLMLAK